MEAFVAGVELWQKVLLVLEPIRVFFDSNRASSGNVKNRTLRRGSNPQPFD
jgi:hypothetical protein